MITDDEFKALKDGDKVCVSLRALNNFYQIDCSFSKENYNCVLPVMMCLVGGGSYRTVLMPEQVMPPLTLRISGWALSPEAVEKARKFYASSNFSAGPFVGWNIERDAVDAIFHGDITSPTVAVRKDESPLPCFECKQFYPMAEPNFIDKLVCWSCRDSNGWKYGMKDGVVFLK